MVFESQNYEVRGFLGSAWRVAVVADVTEPTIETRPQNLARLEMTLFWLLWVLLVLAGALTRTAPTWRALLYRQAARPCFVRVRAKRAGRRPWLIFSRSFAPGGLSPGRPPGFRSFGLAAPSVSMCRFV
jgi:hypothetical protein